MARRSLCPLLLAVASHITLGCGRRKGRAFLRCLGFGVYISPLTIGAVCAPESCLLYGITNVLNRGKAEATVRHVVGLLAAADYSAVEQLSGGHLLSASELRQSVFDYGGTVLSGPFEMSEPEPLDSEDGWWTDIDLHTLEEGRSDLTLSLTLLDSPGIFYRVQVTDLHVL